MTKPVVLFSDNMKTVSVVGVNGDTIVRHAATTLNVSFRKDGGVTIWADGEHASQTTRTDAYGRLSNRKGHGMGNLFR
jgi:hypothetical protein